MRCFRFLCTLLFILALLPSLLSLPVLPSDDGSGSAIITAESAAGETKLENLQRKSDGISATIGSKADLPGDLVSTNPSCVLQNQPAVCDADLNPTRTLTERSDLIPPSFFYKGGVMKRKCLKPEFVITRNRENTDTRGVPVGKWPDWNGPDYPGGRNAALWRIKTKQDVCKGHCECSEDGCYCEAELIQPSPSADVALDEYQSALDKIPKLIRMRNPDYKWNHGNGELTFSKQRKNVGGAAEPYYIEGPSSGSTWDWLRALNAGYGFGSLAGGVSGLSKRESEAGLEEKVVKSEAEIELEKNRGFTDSENRETLIEDTNPSAEATTNSKPRDTRQVCIEGAYES
ncbi:hypothetical protein ABW21_db0200620 [Orbilia brochopaga]|nr:hypothetical protein ABW21_db0200620 [Drechslerella brochopaga]